MNEITWGKLFSDWNKAIIKILAIAPNAILGDEKPKTKAHTDLITRLIPALIVVLSAASITNLSTRAYSHHANWSSYLVGTGLAALVPLAVFVAIKIEGNGYKSVVWIIASVFAFISAAIQYQVYLPTVGIPRLDQVFEASAFGAGVPVAECLLAAMEAFILSQLARKANETQAAEADKQKQSTDDERKRQQEVQVQANEQRKRDIELAAYAAQLTQEAEAKRLELQAKLDIERMKAEAKLQRVSVEKPTKKRDSKVIQPSDSPDNIESKIITYYRMNPLASQRKAAGDLVLSQAKVNRLLADLESRKVIHRNGNGVEILG